MKGGDSVVIDFLESGFYYSFICSVAYITVYTMLAPWWRNPWGRGMIAFSSATTLLLLPTILHLLFGINVSNNFFAWYYTGSLYLAGSIELYRIRWIYRVQQHDTPRGRRRDDTNLIRADKDTVDDHRE